MQSRLFGGVPTVVGSFPHDDAEGLVDSILRLLPEMPAWPQMPGRGFRESMYIQYSEGFPGVVLDADRERLFFRKDARFYEELEGFYQAVVEEDVARFSISREFALGLHLFLDRMRGRPGNGFVKGQVTGPFSFAMMVTDEKQRAAAYDPELNEVVTQGVALKARWMARQLRELGGGALVTLDEPYLCSFGSAFVNVTREEVIAAVGAAVAAIHAEGALAGLHCCGNTDWSLPLETEVDVLNLDAYDWFQGLPLYPAELRSFLDRGGHIAWGIVPTSDTIGDLDADSLLRALDDRVSQLVAKGMAREQLYRQAILTPACGMGSKSVEVADKVLDRLLSVSARLREREKLV
jgi:methionine synthase II (cobalamin-independent)